MMVAYWLSELTGSKNLEFLKFQDDGQPLSSKINHIAGMV